MKWQYFNSENFIDYCSDFSKVFSQESVFVSSENSNFSGENQLFSTDNVGTLIYRTNIIASVTIDFYKKVPDCEGLKLFVSKDALSWEEVSVTVYGKVGLDFDYSRISVKTEQLPFGNSYLKISFSSDIEIGRVGCFTYNELSETAPFDCTLDYEDTLNIVDDAYELSGNFVFNLHFYRKALLAAAFTLEYKGNMPEIALFSSENGENYEPVKIAEVIKEDNENGINRCTVVTEAICSGHNHLKIMLQKSDGSVAPYRLLQMHRCIGGFYTEFNCYNELLDYSSDLKLVRDRGFEGLGMYLENDYFIINKNDIKGFNVFLRKKGKAILSAYTSSNGKDYFPIEAEYDDVIIHLNNYINYDMDYTYCSFRNVEAIPKDHDFVKIVLASGNDGYAEIGSMYIDGENDEVKELKKICRKKGTNFSDVFSIAHVGGRYTFTERSYLEEGVDVVASMGGKSINIWFGSASSGSRVDMNNFHTPSVEGIYSLVDIMNTEYYKRILARPEIKTFIFNVYTGCGDVPYMTKYATEEQFNTFLKQEYQEIYDFCIYMLTNYNHSKKRIICQTWETDWWCKNDSLYLGYTDQALTRMADIMNTRQDAFEAARAEITPIDFEIYNSIEAVDMFSALEGKPCVITRTFPLCRCDMYSYSAYQTTLTEHKFIESLNVFKKYAPESKLLGKNNLYLGEFGIPENEQGDRAYSNLLKAYKNLIINDMLYGVMWELYCNELCSFSGYDGKMDGNTFYFYGSHKNSDFRGFWLIRADGTRTPIYYTFKMALRN